ncbi:hypothetical protein BX286_6325 [Streptomyces sp. 3211.6]|uniref:DUF6461 domain-containing protein n=1 Tax=Streptomyces TaxID=1883 RepID=UPI0009A534CD|nr:MULTISPECIES: DUF6461 domain-containing protein [Streptomyces]RKT08239.1 hypothetical protein BX286_6325 [Streptomyces sp. 3211.6]RPF29638.1 hypothetical protein EDD96_6167 [Streptomyces sp. Ag109_G2-6]
MGIGYQPYIWAENEGLNYGCLTFVRGRNPAETARYYGADPRAAVPLTTHERRTHPAFPDLVSWIELGEWTVAFEEERSRGSDPSLLGQLSLGTEAVSIHTNVLAHYRFRYAADGQTLTYFDALSPHTRHGTEPDRFVDAMRLIGLDPDIPPDLEELDDDPQYVEYTLPMLLALTEHVTAIRLKPEFLDTALTAVTGRSNRSTLRSSP